MNYVDQIAKLITEDPDILNEVQQPIRPNIKKPQGSEADKLREEAIKDLASIFYPGVTLNDTAIRRLFGTAIRIYEMHRSQVSTKKITPAEALVQFGLDNQAQPEKLWKDLTTAAHPIGFSYAQSNTRPTA